MTYEQLIVYIDGIAPTLPGCGLRLLLRLVSIGIQTGSNEVRLSLRSLAADLGLSKDAIAVAIRSLAPDIRSVSAPGVPMTFTLPESWFSPQRSLFLLPDDVENPPRRPGFQDTSVLKTRTAVSVKPGHSVLETRTGWADYQDTPSWKPGQLSLKPGHSVLETRTLHEQNQQLTDVPLDRSNRVLSSVDTSLNPRDSIEGVNCLPPECGEHADKLKRWLRGYFEQHHRSHNPPPGPDEIIIAKCLAMASLANLAAILRTLDKKKTSPGDSWAWFVTVFCSRIHRTRELDKVPAPPAFRQTRKPPSGERDADFTRDLLQQTAAGVHTM